MRGGGDPCRRPWGLGGGRVGGGKEEGCTGNGFPPTISEEGPRREGSHGGGRRCRAWRRPGLGEKEEGDGGILFPHSPSTRVQRSVLATGAGGGGKSLLGRRRLRAEVDSWG